VDWLFGCVELIDENINKLNKTIRGNDGDLLASLLLWNGSVITTPSTITVRRKCLKNLKFDTNFSTAADQDFVFNLAASFHGKYYDFPSVKYRVVKNSMSKDIFVMQKDHIGVYKKAVDNGLFKSFWHKQKCFSNLYLIIAGSWWKDGDSKMRGMYFVFRALVLNPFTIIKLINK
jgi:hypothetical protein